MVRLSVSTHLEFSPLGVSHKVLTLGEIFSIPFLLGLELIDIVGLPPDTHFILLYQLFWKRFRVAWLWGPVLPTVVTLYDWFPSRATCIRGRAGLFVVLLPLIVGKSCCAWDNILSSMEPMFFSEPTLSGCVDLIPRVDLGQKGGNLRLTLTLEQNIFPVLNIVDHSCGSHRCESLHQEFVRSIKLLFGIFAK